MHDRVYICTIVHLSSSRYASNTKWMHDRMTTMHDRALQVLVGMLQNTQWMHDRALEVPVGLDFLRRQCTIMGFNA